MDDRTPRNLGRAFGLAFLLVAVALGATGQPLRPGDQAPSVSFEDIDGTASGTDSYAGWVQVITFADRESSKRVGWMGEAQAHALRTHPEVRIATFGFADLSMVPRLLRGMVLPFLRSSQKNSQEKSDKALAHAGLTQDPDRVASHLIPDWDGSYFADFGIQDTSAFQCVIAFDGKIVAAFDDRAPGIADRYRAAFERIAGARTQPVEVSATPARSDAPPP